MQLLLETLVMLLLLLNNPRLKAASRDLMATTASAVSADRIWDFAINHSLLIAQARVEALISVSADARWPDYPVLPQRA